MHLEAILTENTNHLTTWLSDHFLGAFPYFSSPTSVGLAPLMIRAVLASSVTLPSTPTMHSANPSRLCHNRAWQSNRIRRVPWVLDLVRSSSLYLKAGSTLAYEVKTYCSVALRQGLLKEESDLVELVNSFMSSLEVWLSPSWKHFPSHLFSHYDGSFLDMWVHFHLYLKSTCTVEDATITIYLYRNLMGGEPWADP